MIKTVFWNCLNNFDKKTLLMRSSSSVSDDRFLKMLNALLRR